MTSRVRRRVGYYHKRIDGTLDIALSKIDFDEECYEELTSCSKAIFELKPILIAFDMAKNNYDEIIESSNSYREFVKKELIPGPGYIQKSIDRMVVLTQRINNFLSSASSFLNNTEIKVDKVFGGGSCQSNLWNEYRRGLHKDSFSYRFMYELRNYSQHYGLPMSAANFDVANMLENTPSVNLSMSIYRESLLEENFNWKKLESEIRKLEKNTDIGPYLEEYMGILKKLIIKYLDLFKKKMLECFEYLTAFHKAFEIPEGVLPMLFIGEGNKTQPIPSKMVYMPADQFQWVHGKYLELMKNKA
jgi:hypothetical protein